MFRVQGGIGFGFRFGGSGVRAFLGSRSYGLMVRGYG